MGKLNGLCFIKGGRRGKESGEGDRGGRGEGRGAEGEWWVSTGLRAVSLKYDIFTELTIQEGMCLQC